MNATRLLTATTFLLAFGHSAVAQTAATTSSQFGVTAPMRRAAPDTLRHEGVALERKVPVGRLLASGRHAVERLARNQGPTTSPSSTKPTGKSWPKRHPVLTGAFVGAAIGAAWGATWCPSNGDCTGWTEIYTAVDAGEGFGFGALAGWLISR
jgi:hypothetical protein